MEVGLGGRLDATNVIAHPLATVITPISVDHVDFLGDSLDKIAAEKAGILKRNTPAIVAAQPRDALAVIERQAARLKRAAQDRRRGLDRDRGARPSRLSGRHRPARSAGAETFRPASVRECRARHRHAARDQGLEDCAGRVRGRADQGRLAGAAATADARRACRAGAAGQRSLARRRPQSGRRPRHCRGARRSGRARVAPAGAHRRHAGEQGLRGLPGQFHRAGAAADRGAGAERRQRLERRSGRRRRARHRSRRRPAATICRKRSRRRASSISSRRRASSSPARSISPATCCARTARR